ncbi:MAG: hypothetical protein JWQ87_528 [Candidatus Sulfotelmatobacter sp.]|nr:hypothetical protein [Candidatus Sulfotelmatobacter sp.]
MRREPRKNVRRQFIALLLCALFGLGIIGLGEGGEKEQGNGNVYRRVFLRTDQPHNGQDRGDESDTINVTNSFSVSGNSTARVTRYSHIPFETL